MLNRFMGRVNKINMVVLLFYIRVEGDDIGEVYRS